LPMSCLKRHYKEHLKDWFKKDKSFDKEYKAFTMKNTT